MTNSREASHGGGVLLRNVYALCALALALVACRPPDSAQFVGCYDAAVGPSPNRGTSDTLTGGWVRLDSARAAIRGEFRIRTRADLSKNYYITGYWKPLSRDSISVVWGVIHAGPSYRLKYSNQILSGTGEVAGAQVYGIQGKRWAAVAHAVACDSPGYLVRE